MNRSSEILKELRNAISAEEKFSWQEYSLYWGKKKPDIARKIIDSFCEDGDCVIDPFIGSGSTIYGGLHSRRKVSLIGVDINEFPLNQIEFNLTEFSHNEINLAKTILSNLNDKFKHLYRYDYGRSTLTFKKAFVDLSSGISIPTYLEFLDDSGRKTSFGPNDDGFNELKFKYMERNQKLEHQEDYQLNTNSRIAIKSGMKISSLFSTTNFQILCELRFNLSESKLLKGILRNSLHLCKYTDKGSQSQFPYWYPKKDAVDRNILQLLFKRLENFLKLHDQKFSSLFDQAENIKNIKLIKKPSQEISLRELPKKIKLIITDPPYFDQVAYSEYLAFWSFFTGDEFNLEDEIVVSQRTSSPKNKTDYLREMEIAFKNFHSLALPNAKLFLYYKDSRLSNIGELLDLLSRAGWKFLGQTHLANATYSYKQNATQGTTVSGDCLMVFESIDNKPVNSRLSEKVLITKNASAEKVVLELISNYLATQGEESSLSQIYDECLVPQLYEKNLLNLFRSPAQIVEILSGKLSFDPISRKWSLNSEI